MAQSLKIECVVSDISKSGEVASTLVTKEQLDSSLAKKASLVDGRVPESQLPSSVSSNSEEMRKSISEIDKKVDNNHQSAKDYAEAYTDDALTSKADLVNGKIPSSQLPNLAQEKSILNALESVEVSAHNSMVTRTDELQRTKADLDENGKLDKSQMPSYRDVPDLENALSGIDEVKADKGSSYLKTETYSSSEIETMMSKVGAVEHNSLIDKDVPNAHIASAILDSSGQNQQVLNDKFKTVEQKADKAYVDQLVINANAGLVNYKTEVELLAFKPTQINYTAKALDTKKVWWWDGSKWNDTGLSELDLAIAEAKKTIEQAGDNYEFITQDGFKIAEIGKDIISTVDFEMRNTNDNRLSAVSQDGFDLNPQFEQEPVDLSLAFKYTDEQIHQLKPNLIDTTKPLFTNLLVGFDSEDININVECLVAQRALQRKQRTVVASLSANSSNYFKQSSEVLSIQANKINGSVKLYLRDINSYNYTSLDITVKSVAKSVLSGSPKILMIGDSITNRGGAAIVDSVLRSTGMTPSFIGTITGAGTDQTALGTGGKLNEGREGWRTTQFTNALADKTPVPVGGEADYLALVKNDKIKWNPFIRIATSEDDASIIKNGYVLDFEFYCSRFSLETPDIVVLQLGTNDIVYAPATSEQNVYDNILFIMQRLRVAFPNCKIIVSAVGRAISTATTDAQYDSLYPPVFRSTQKAIKDSAFTNVYFCPSFAISDTFSGFPVTATETDSISGAITGAYSDGLHPTYSGRQTLYTNISAYIAAATINLI